MDITRINDFILKMFFSESWWGVQFQYVPVSPVDIAIYGKPQCSKPSCGASKPCECTFLPQGEADDDAGVVVVVLVLVLVLVVVVGGGGGGYHYYSYDYCHCYYYY